MPRGQGPDDHDADRAPSDRRVAGDPDHHREGGGPSSDDRRGGERAPTEQGRTDGRGHQGRGGQGQGRQGRGGQGQGRQGRGGQGQGRQGRGGQGQGRRGQGRPAGPTRTGRDSATDVARGGLLQGAVAGVAAFVLGYLALYLLKGGEFESNFRSSFAKGTQLSGASVSQLQELGLTLPEKWKVVGMAYHGVHGTDLSVTAEGPGGEVSRTMPGEFYSGTLPKLIPVVVLLAAGYVVASRLDVGTSGEGAAAGATVAVGYVAAAVVTTFPFTWSTTISGPGGSASLSIGPALGSSVLFLGLYAAVLGAVGGAAVVVAGNDGGRPRPRQRRR